MINLDLLPGEEILKTANGDCWKTPDTAKSQVPGQYLFTNQRIVFRGNGIIEKMRLKFEIFYQEIQSVETYRVVFFNTGILLQLKNGDNYRLSLKKRELFVDLIRTHMDKA